MDDQIHPVDKHVGARIRARRKLLRLSQSQLADAVDKTFQQIQKYERGANRVSSSVLYLFARELKVEIGHFFEGLPGFDQDLDLTAEPDEILAMMAQFGGPELAKIYCELDRLQRASLLSVAKAIHSATAVASAAA